MTADKVYIGGRGEVKLRQVPDSGVRRDLTGRDAGRCSWPLRNGERAVGRWRVVQQAAERDVVDAEQRLRLAALALVQRAFETFARLPMTGLFPAGLRSAMPEVVHDAAESYGWNETRSRPAAPSGAEILEADWVAAHTLTLSPADKAILIGLGLSLSLRAIGRKVGLSHERVRQRGNALLLALAAAYEAKGKRL